MTEYIQEPMPPSTQDAVSSQSHVPGTAQPIGTAQPMSPNVFDEHKDAVVTADSMHETMMSLARQNSALMSRLSRYEQPQEVVAAPPGGAPVAHHLHLVDGRVVVNHGGIGTHFSETLSDGSSRVTRIKEYFPVIEPDPSTLNA